jgi:hypothetical protein
VYVDESGDTGLGAGSSDLFILSAIIVHEAFWTDVLNEMYRIRRGMYERHGFGTTREMHAENMLGRHRKNGPGMSRRDCVLMLREVIRTEANLPHVRSMSVVVDKRDKNPGFNVFEAAWGTLIERFESAIKAGVLPRPSSTASFPEHGFIIVDETDEKKLRTLVRNMRFHMIFPQDLYPGDDHHVSLDSVIEDPMHKQSELSLPIQFCDVNAYFLKQTIQPNSTVLKHKARNYFYYLDPILLKGANADDPHGIVRK